jgi:hypothetical protein
MSKHTQPELTVRRTAMSKAELLVLLGGQRETLKRRYAVRSLAIFGSASRDALVSLPARRSLGEGGWPVESKNK